MANISVTYTFSNGSTADAGEVNTNYQDIIDGTTDGTKDFSISALTCAGTLTANGAVNLGNATTDDITVTGRIASDLDPKTASANDLGDATQLWRYFYGDNVRASINAVGDPSYSFHADTDTGMYSSGANSLDFATGGTRALYIDSSQVVRPVTAIDMDGAKIRTLATEDVSVDASGADIDWSTNNYTILDTDTYVNFYCTTGSTNRTITLPTASANEGRIVTIKKVDSGSGLLTLTEELSDAIDGYSSVVCPLQYDFVTVQSDGSTWHIIVRNYVSRWATYTPTFAGFGTPDADEIKMEYRRVGESCQIRGSFETGTPTAVEGQVGLPNGVAIGGTSTYAEVVGHWHRNAAGGSFGTPLPSLGTYGETYINYGRQIIDSSGNTTNNLLTPQNGDRVGTLERQSIKAEVPVQEWTDTV